MISHARDVMSSPVVRIEQDASLLDAHRLLVEEQIHGVPVVDSDGCVVGVLSGLDLLRAVEEEHESSSSDTGYYRDLLDFSSIEGAGGLQDFQDRLSQLRVRDAMSTSVVTVRPETSIAEVARMLRENAIHRVLVADEDRLVGIVSTFDLLRLFE